MPSREAVSGVRAGATTLPDRPVWSFLVPAVLPPKPQFMAVGFLWIFLDSFVRIVTFQWATRHKRAKEFSSRLFPKLEAPKGRPNSWMQKRRRIAHEPR